MQMFLTSGHHAQEVRWQVRPNNGQPDSYSLLGLSEPATGCDVHIAGLTAAQLHALSLAIMKEVPLLPALPAPETETDPFADVLANPALAGT